MHQVISEFVNLFVEKHIYLNNVNFLNIIGMAVWLSWSKRLSSKQEMLSSKFIAVLCLVAKYQMAAKNKAAMSLQLNISCLLVKPFTN